jgi:hypothetical protein
MLDNRGVVRLPVGARDISFLANCPYRFSKPSQRRIQQVQGVLSSGCNCKTDHSPPSSSEVKHEYSRISTPSTRLLGVHKDSFNFYQNHFYTVVYRITTQRTIWRHMPCKTVPEVCFLFWSCPSILCIFKALKCTVLILFLGSANRWRGRRSVCLTGSKNGYFSHWR